MLTTDRPTLRYFVSYSRNDLELKDDLLRRLRLRMGLAREYRFDAWEDTGILPGEAWKGEITNALAACAFGLLLVSYEFLASPFISAHELPRFVGPEADRRAIPVALRVVRFDGTMDLKGLEDVQVFRLDRRHSYGELSSDRERDRFADQLFEQILRVARKYF